MKFLNPTVTFDGLVQIDGTPSANNHAITKSFMEQNAVVGIHSGSANYAEIVTVDGKQKLKIKPLQITDVSVDDSANSLAAWISANYSAGTEKQEGDVIIRFDNKNISDPSNLRNIVSLMAPGSKSDVVVVRDGSNKVLNVLLQELKDGKQIAVKTSSKTSILGLELKEIDNSLMKQYGIEEGDGRIVVISVDPGSEAAEKGLVEGDVIKRVGTQKVNSLKEFTQRMK